MLRIDEVARQRGLSLSRFQIATALPLSTARRLWHSSATGAAAGRGTLRQVNLATLEHVADVLQVEVFELFKRDVK